jgi:hypothetical protein
VTIASTAFFNDTIGDMITSDCWDAKNAVTFKVSLGVTAVFAITSSVALLFIASPMLGDKCNTGDTTPLDECASAHTPESPLQAQQVLNVACDPTTLSQPPRVATSVIASVL